jgi:hypothetical protein
MNWENQTADGMKRPMAQLTGLHVVEIDSTWYKNSFVLYMNDFLTENSDRISPVIFLDKDYLQTQRGSPFRPLLSSPS